MPYGTIKVDNIVFTNSGVDQTIGVSGLVQSVSGNLTASGTISGNLIRGNTVSGATITGGVLTVASGIFSSGTVSAPSIGFTGDGNTGFWTPAGDTVALSTGGSERLRVDSDGDLGVGTTDPTSRLTVRADATSGPNTIIRVENRAASAGATTQNIKIEGIFDYNNGTSDASAGAIVFGKDGTYTTATTNNDSYLAFETTVDNTSTEKLRINSVGQVVTTISGTAAAPALNVGNDLNTGIYSPGADQVAISTGGTGRLFIDADGDIGIGVETPTRQIDIATANTTAGLGYTIRLRANATAGASAIQWTTSDASQTNGYIACDTSRDIYFASGSTERMRISLAGTTTITSNAATAPFIAKISTSEVARIDSSGRLLVGTSTARAQFLVTPQLQVEGISGNTSSLSLIANANSTVGAYIFLGKSRGTSVGANTAVQQNDLLGGLYFQGANGTDLSNCAGSLEIYVDGEPFTAGDTTDLPGRLVFSTTADGAASPTERMVIKADGKVGIGTSSPGGALDVAVGGAGPARIICSQSSDNPYIDFYRSTGIGSNFTGFRQRQILGNFVFENAPSNTIGSHTFTERARIDSSGRLLVGTSAAIDDLGHKLHVAETTGTNTLLWHGSATATAPGLQFVKNRTTTATHAIVSSGDRLGRISFSGSDGASYITGAWIQTEVDGTPGANDMPGRLVFSTTADGAASPTERMRIDSSGSTLFATTTNPTTGTFSRPVISLKQLNDSSFASAIHIEANADQSVLGIGYNGSAFGFTTSFRGTGAYKDIVFAPGGTEKARVTSAGTVGIGASSSPGGLDTRAWIDQSSITDYGLVINASGGTKIPTLWLRDASATQPGRIVGQSSLTLATTSSATTAVTIDSSQRVLIGTASATANGGVLQVSNGITFPATQSACSDANTLDDYEEGTWTPSLQFGNATTNITYTVQKGLYTKIGNTVRIVIDIQLSSKGTATGAATIAGFPFTINNTNGTSVATGMSTITTDSKGNLLLLMASATTAQLRGQNSNSDYTDAAFGASTIIRFTGTYQVS